MISLSRNECHRQAYDPDQRYIYRTSVEEQVVKYMKLRALSESLKTKRPSRVKNISSVNDLTVIYRNQWSALLRVLWADPVIISLFAMTPSETVIPDVPLGFLFICRTLAEVVMEKIFYDREKLMILADEGIIPLSYSELPLVGVDGMV